MKPANTAHTNGHHPPQAGLAGPATPSARSAPTSPRLHRAPSRPHPEATTTEWPARRRADQRAVRLADGPGAPEHDLDQPGSAGTAGRRVVADLVRQLAAPPTAVLGAAISGGSAVLGWTVQAVAVGVRLPDQVTDLMGHAYRIVGEVDRVLDDARRITTEVTEVVASARESTAGADEVVGGAGSTSGTVQELLALYEPLAREAAPLVQRFVDDLSGAEVNAAIKLVDQLPEFTEHMQHDIMPILKTLDQVAPDLHELLDVAKKVRQAIDGVPGSGFLRKRGEAKDDQPTDRSA